MPCLPDDASFSTKPLEQAFREFDRKQPRRDRIVTFVVMLACRVDDHRAGIDAALPPPETFLVTARQHHADAREFVIMTR